MKTTMKVMKFGGSSVGNAVAIKLVKDLVKKDASLQKLVVVSAQQGITDMLLGLVDRSGDPDNITTKLNEVTKDLGIEVPAIPVLIAELKAALEKNSATESYRDSIAGYGELLSIQIISTYFNTQGIKAQPVDARQLVFTDSTFGNANYCVDTTTDKSKQILLPLLDQGIVPIISGFIGSNKEGQTTTLGRGGSDLTATLIGQCLQADVIDIWSDADGIMTADPRKIENSTIIPELTYEEAVELSNFGAKIIYSRSLIPAIEANIPVYILNTFNPDSKGTLIQSSHQSNYYAVTSKDKVSIITIYNPKMIGAVGYLANLFNAFKELNLSIDVISVSEASVSVTVQNINASDTDSIVQTLSQFGTIDVMMDCAIVAVISNYFKNDKGLFAMIMDRIKQSEIQVNLISYGNSKINLTLVIQDSSQSVEAVKQIHDLLSNQ